MREVQRDSDRQTPDADGQEGRRYVTCGDLVVKANKFNFAREV